MKNILFCCFLFSLLSFALPLLAQTRWYVDADATGAETGLSWEDAFTDLQLALASAAYGDEIWVAEGTYKPTDTEDQSISFVLPSGVKLYGGFAGTETALEQRDWESHLSILSGDIGEPDYMPDNSQTVVYAEDVDSTTLMDGLLIRDGYADGEWASGKQSAGGGLYCNALDSLGRFDITLKNCRFENNWANWFGGAVFFTRGPVYAPLSFTIEDCVFVGNRVDTINPNANLDETRAGGAMATFQLSYHKSFLIKNSVFKDNFCIGYAAAVFAWVLAPIEDVQGEVSFIVDSCLFDNNESLALPPAGYISAPLTVIGDFFPNEMHYYVRHNTFRNNKGEKGSGISCFIPLVGQTYDALFVEDNVFENNEGPDVLYGIPSSLYIYPRSVIRNNCFKGDSYVSGGIDGDIVLYDAEARIYNNFFLGQTGVNLTVWHYHNRPVYFFNNTCYGLSGYRFLMGGNPPEDFYLELYNNIFYQEGSSPLAWSNYGVEHARLKISHCLLSLEDEADIAPFYEEVLVGEGMQYGVSDMGFVDPASDYYDLEPCSPAVNAGSNEVIWEQWPVGEDMTDVAGRPRILDGYVDIGAYEAGTIELDTLLVFKPSCPEASDGSVLFAASDYCPQPAGSYEISWPGGTVQGDFYIENLSAGDYVFTLTDSKGRSAEMEVNLSVEDPPDLDLEVSVVPTLPGLDQGQVLILNTEGGHAPYSYLWEDGDTAAFHTGLSPGWHTVTITDALGCSWEESWEVEVYTGVASPEPLALSLFPNPASSRLQISGPPQSGELEIRDAMGRLVRASSFPGGSMEMDVSTLPRGLYILFIRTKLGAVFSGRVVLVE